jgi:hypothetical protein
MSNGNTHVITSKLSEKDVNNLKLKSCEEKLEKLENIELNWEFEGDSVEYNDNYIDEI